MKITKQSLMNRYPGLSIARSESVGYSACSVQQGGEFASSHTVALLAHAIEAAIEADYAIALRMDAAREASSMSTRPVVSRYTVEISRG